MANGTQVRRVLLQIDADDGDTEAKLDRISARADELGKKHPELQVKIDSAAAAAKLSVLRAELRDVGKTVTADVKVDDGKAITEVAALDLELDRLKKKNDGSGPGLLSKIMNGSGGSGGSSALSGIPVLGPMLENPAVLLAVIPAIMAAGTEIGALATGLTAAGLGVGAFAALAMPAFKSVSGAYAQINADQQAYNRALTATAKSTALAHLKQDYANLDPAQRGAVKGLQDLTGEYHKLSKAFEPTAFKVFNEGLGIANKLLPYVGQFANAAAPAIEGVLGQLGHGLGSPQFKYFADFLKSLSGPVITAVGSGMKGLAGDVMILMERFSKKDVVNSVNIAFRLLGFTVSLVTGLIMEGMIAWDFLTQKALPTASKAFDVTRHAVAHAGQEIAMTFDSVRHNAATLAHDTAAHFDEIRHDTAQWAGDVRHDTDRVVSFFRELPHRVVSGVGDLGHLLWNDGVHIIDGLIGGIESKFGALESRVTGLGGDVVGWAEHALGIKSPSTRFITIGQQITAGLSLGIAQTTAQAVAKGRSLAQAVTTAALTGAITASQALALRSELAEQLSAALRHSIGQAVGASMARSLDSSSLSRIGHASIDALKQIWGAESGGLISRGGASSLAVLVKADNARLQSLAIERNAITKRIAAAKAYAANITSSTEATFGVVAAAGSITPALGVGGIMRQLLGDVAQIRTFKANIAKLRKMGLNKAYIDQLIQAGPVQGAAVAAELAAANEGDIRGINKAEAQIAQASVSLGHTAANAMFDSGKQAGKGFLSGLQSQEKQLEAAMRKLADVLVNTIRKDLKIHSPSQVAYDLFAQVGAGGVLAIDDSHTAMTAASSRLARAAVSGRAHAGGGAGGGAGHFTFEWVGGSADQALITLLKKHIRVHGGDPAVLGA